MAPRLHCEKVITSYTGQVSGNENSKKTSQPIRKFYSQDSSVYYIPTSTLHAIYH